MDEPTASAAGTPSVPAHAGVKYAVFRVLLLVVVGAVLYLLGMRDLPWLITTVLLSAGLSFFVLLRQREAAARSLEATMSARAGRRRGADAPAQQPSASDPSGPTDAGATADAAAEPTRQHEG